MTIYDYLCRMYAPVIGDFPLSGISPVRTTTSKQTNSMFKAVECPNLLMLAMVAVVGSSLHQHLHTQRKFHRCLGETH